MPRKRSDPLYHIRVEIETFDRLLPYLRSKHMGRHVLIIGKQFVASFDSERAAFEAAYPLAGSRGPFIVKQVEPAIGALAAAG